MERCPGGVCVCYTTCMVDVFASKVGADNCCIWRDSEPVTEREGDFERQDSQPGLIPRPSPSAKSQRAPFPRTRERVLVWSGVGIFD